MSDMGTGAEGAQAEGAPQVDFSPVLDRVNELSTQVQEFTNNFQGQPQQQQDYGYDQFGYDPYQQQEPGFQYGQPEPQYAQQQQAQPDQQQALGELQQIINQSVGQAMSPLMQRLNAQELDKVNAARDAEWQKTVDKYPELAGDAGQQFITQANEQANAIAMALMPMIDPGAPQQEQQAMAQDLGRLIAEHPSFRETAYLASKATIEAGGEIPASASQGNELEPAGGAAQQPGEPDAASQWMGTGSGPRTLSQLGF